MTMKIALISCGRSDYSIYLPLMKKLKADSFFELNIIAFGTHVSQFYNRTVDMFYKDDFNVAYEIESLVLGDSPEAISSAMGLTIVKFSSIWSREDYDIILVLGDRYEMFSAISASVPFGTPVAHLHGGEKTEGAFDDMFRHSISTMSKLHFVSTPGHAKRVAQIIGKNKHIYHVGAPALDNLHELKLLSIQEFRKAWDIDLSKPTVLVTYHPETIASNKNVQYVRQLCKAMDALDKQFVITMPNNDTMGTVIRKELLSFVGDNTEKYKIVEVLGSVGYYSCMQHCNFLLGNTSSGIVEAASFGKYVINIGDRQKGREAGANVIHVNSEANAIIDTANKIESMLPFSDGNIYGNGDTTQKVLAILKDYYNSEIKRKK
jgi:GDP/UDP-N,N'-diacetylbacillosamine 2-epimerase (hydrolysing)